jgi:succinyl-CoA synthetase alpha subunit
VPIAAIVRPNLYKDSVALMRVSELVLARAGVRRATLLMGTPANKGMLREAGLWQAELDAARPNDVMIVVEADTLEAIEVARNEVEHALAGERPAQESSGTTEGERAPRALALARGGGTFALAQVSVPGPYAAAEAMKALKLGMHVFLFSDNVPLEQEQALKALARSRNLLVMGPDCGTAIIRGVPLGFANVVRRGAIGLVGASGTGLQEVACQIHARGQGVSQVIGTGGRDMHEAIGGSTMCQAIDLLAADPDTRVIGIVSKSPTPVVATTVIAHAVRTGKPCVVLFLGADAASLSLPANVVAVATLEDAAAATVALAAGGRPEFASGMKKVDPSAVPAAMEIDPVAAAEARRYAPSQRHLRGLFSGGTFCTEAQLLWRALDVHAASNVPLDAANRLAEDAGSKGHVAIDFGAGEFTVGRPHPMIDLRARIERLVQEARDASVAVVTLDVVLGYGSHDDPAAALAPAIAQAIGLAAAEGRHLSIVCFVCGTEDDPQALSDQRAKLAAAGALVMPGSTAAARLAGALAVAAARVPLAAQRDVLVGQ